MSRMRREPFAIGFAFLAIVLIMGYWVVSANQLDVTVTHDGVSGPRLVVDEDDPEPIVIALDPPRRSDGAQVRVDGTQVPHPPGTQPGELLWFVGDLQPGVHTLEVRVSRPTWFVATYTVEIEVRPLVVE